MQKNLKKGLISGVKFICFFGVWIFFLFLFNAVVETYINKLANPATLRLWLEITPLFAVIIATILFCIIERKKIIRYVPLDNPVKNLGLGVGVGVVWIVLPILLPMLLKKIEVQAMNQVNSFWIWAIALFLNAVMQELLVRGYLFGVLKNDYNSPTAIVVTTVLFTLLHGGAFEAGVISVLNVIGMSILMSVILLQTESLVAPIMMHFIWNFVGGLVFDLISIADDYPAWLSTKKTHGFFVDKNFGIEGSAFVLLINSLLIAFFVLYYKNKNSIKHEIKHDEYSELK